MSDIKNNGIQAYVPDPYILERNDQQFLRNKGYELKATNCRIIEMQVSPTLRL